MKAGDWVVCVDDRHCSTPPYDVLRKGQIYRISSSNHVFKGHASSTVNIENSHVNWITDRFVLLSTETGLTDLEKILYNV